MESITVLMSTYNGEKYIEEQIDSILSQENVDISLIIRDDGSSDRTVDIINEYVKNDNRVSFYSGNNLGPAYSFLDLITEAPPASYYALSDQDDVWDSDKLYVAIEKLKHCDQEKPALYYSNLKVVDGDLNFIKNSHKIPLVQKDRYSFLVEPVVTGCTCVFNKAAKEKIECKKPEYISMHDTWIHMVCSFFGNVVYDFEPHIMYRQHGNNVIGAYNGGIMQVIKRVERLFDRNLQPRYYNAISFLRCYERDLSELDLCKIKKIARYKDSIKGRMSLLLDKDLHATSFSREVRNRLLIIVGLI